MKTLALIKPDAVLAGHMMPILDRIAKNFTIDDIVMGRWTRTLAAQFYAEHHERPFFGDLVDFMTSGSVVALTLSGPADSEVITRWRVDMGATDPKKAAAHTIRGLYGSKTGPMMWNAVHGSDSAESATREINILRNALKEGRYARIHLLGTGEREEPLVGTPVEPDEENDQSERDDAVVPEERYGVHASHCCQVHGCKYSSQEPGPDAACPVSSGKIKREKDAGWCQEPNLVLDPEVCRWPGERMPEEEQ